MPAWSLPEAIADILPAEAARIESLRRRLLDRFAAYGYELVMPPMLEYVESLLSGTGRDLDLQMFKLVDQMSGRTMGLRADITPQVARIDAHLLNRDGVTRLCYAGSVVYTRPRSPAGTREPFVVGAELYGHADIEADLEVQSLLFDALDTARIASPRIDLGHVEILRAILAADPRGFMMAETVYPLLQAKAHDGIAALGTQLAPSTCEALIALSRLYGGVEVIERARRELPALPRIRAALATLERLSQALASDQVSIDLGDMRGYHYHSGTMFAVYVDGFSGAIARGGRYDEVGLAFGRARPATGFSLDLRDLARIASRDHEVAPIDAPWGEDAALKQAVAALRASGEIVVQRLGDDASPPSFTRRLVRRDGAWVVETARSVAPESKAA
jgi:ATP phosphoribosyltransferase regulatory subunit